MAALLVACLGVGVPAAALRLACVGRSCAPADATSGVAFCSLPEALRRGLVDGFYEGRSPDVLGVAAMPVAGGTAWRGGGPPWPQADAGPARVPLAFAGSGVAPAGLAAGTGLDTIAPTIARAIGLHRRHPEVRSGAALDDVTVRSAPRLVLVVVWKGIGSAGLAASGSSAPWLESVLRSGAGTTAASVGSLPVDPAAILTTIGTGGLPRQHGISGSIIRDAGGNVVRAWSAAAPVSVIATLGDDLDEQMGQEPRIGLVGTRPEDAGLIGGRWYVEVDRDDVAIGPRAPLRAAHAAIALARGRAYGADGVPDLLGVVLEGGVPELDTASRRLARALRKATGNRMLLVVTATGDSSPGNATPAREIERGLARRLGTDVVEATVPGGFFFDQRRLARRSLAQDEILKELTRLGTGAGGRVFAELFPDLAVTFARYC